MVSQRTVIKIFIICKKTLASFENIIYTNNCCGMIAMKREVAAFMAGFPWSECQVRKLTTSHCTNREVRYRYRRRRA